MGDSPNKSGRLRKISDEMEELKENIFHTEPFKRFAERSRLLAKDQLLTIHGAAGSLMAFAAAAAFTQRDSQLLLVASSREKAEKLRDDCALLLGETNVRYYGERPTHHAQMLDMTSSIAQIETLKALSTGMNLVVVATPQSLVAKVPQPEQFIRHVIELHTNADHTFTQLIDDLSRLGFERKQFVEGYGDFSVRGGILDVFPFVGDHPVRLEFWDDTIESIREFDILSQRSIRELQSAAIVPDMHGEDVEMGTASIFNYLKQDTVVLLDEAEIIQREVEELFREGVGQIFAWHEIQFHLKGFRRIVHSAIRTAGEPSMLEFGAASQPSFNGSIKALVQEIDRLNGAEFTVYLTCDTKQEADRLEELIDEELAQTPVSEARPVSPSAGQAHLLQRRIRLGWKPLAENHKPFALLAESLHSGFIFPSARLAVFTEHEIFGRLKRRETIKRRRFKGFTQKELHQLKRGDFVVHADYGIGQFAGLQRISIRGAEQEVMKVLYLENDILYINLNYINRVQKYASYEGHLPKLSKLGAPDWERLKRRAKHRVKDIARELIQLYALRKHEKGLGFSPDSHYQKEMEASFLYEDTPDQARAVMDAKHDMEGESPMDRLICGDVGFGKTEVAVRAAFKAVFDGKQVAVLVPTTILAQQHYNTFHDRLGRYAVRAEFISRFKTKKEQKAILGALQSGGIDIIIGTHRLLSKDVQFKDFGLLVIDEEQRFGVAAKEKLKQLKTTVDTLTLTATPIPRTLHFSLMGARDISLMNTPPRNRLPIITEIAQFDWKIIREAILKELYRGGQVYFVHDRIQKIDAIQALLEEHVPEARCEVAHGQMHGHQLEKVMINFLEKKFEVLICTKIIESGIDIPNVNTTIINRADRFGLAELYQLRGRVGRSNIQAYAYLLTPPISALPKEAIRRLQAIEEFTELGSGFNLAMRDLEIRGAGNLLGAEQSGFIVEMGYETYERIVREAVEELKREEFTDLFSASGPQAPHLKPPTDQQTRRTIIDADVDAYIPEFYLESDSERLEVYRRLSRVENTAEIDELRPELRDRFGDYPPEVENLFLLVELRLLASKLCVEKLTVKDGGASLLLPDGNDSSFYGEDDGKPSTFQKMLDAVSKMSAGAFQLKQEKKNLTLVITSKALGNGINTLTALKSFFTRLLENV